MNFYFRRPITPEDGPPASEPRSKSPGVPKSGKKQPDHTMSLLEEDLYLWTKHVAKAIRDGTLDPAEWENVADEIEGIGVRDALAISDLLGRIPSTMLRLKHEAGQPMGDLLKALLLNGRIALKLLLECSPSLYDEAKDEVQGAY